MQVGLEFSFNIGFCTLLLLFGTFLSPVRAESYDSIAKTYYMDSVTGLDTNNGSIYAPFASFEAIQKLSNGETSPADFMVYLSPGEYLLKHFSYPFNQNWVFSTCRVCPEGAKSEGRASVLISPLPNTSTFQEKHTGLAKKDPQLTFWNMDFLPGQNDIFDAPIFSVTKGGVAFTNCSVQNFNISYESDATSGGLVSITEGPLIYHGFVAINNRVACLNIASKFLSPIFGISFGNDVLVNNSKFETNQILGWVFTGGLVSCTDCTMRVSNATFRNNTGYAMLQASGMSLYLGGASQLYLEDSIFDSNQLLVLPYSWSGNKSEALGVTYGGAIGFTTETKHIVLKRSQFIRNLASEGGSLYVGDPQVGFSRATALKVTGHDLRFEANQAASGLGAAMVIQGPFEGMVSFYKIDMIANKVSKGGHLKRYPGSPLSSALPVEPCVALFEGLASVLVDLEDWSFVGPQDQLNGNSTFSTTHRIRVHSALDFVLSYVSYTNILLNLNETSAFLIDIRDAKSSTIIGVTLGLASHPSPSLPTPLNSLVLFSCQGDAVDSQFRISQLTFSDTTHSQITVLIARGLKDVTLSYFTMRSQASSTAPLAVFEDCSLVSFIFVRLANFAGPIIVLDTQRFAAFNSIFENYKGRDPIFMFSRSSNISYSKCNLSKFTNMAIRAQIFQLFQVKDSHFSNGELSRLGGSVSLSEGGAAVIDRSSWSNISGVQGSAISTSQLGLLSISECNFTSTVARLSGGAIQFGGSNLVLMRSRFHKCWAIGGSGGAVEAKVWWVFSKFTVFEDCGASETGGAVHLNSSDTLLVSVIANCSFIRNKANSGGALTLAQSSLNISNSTFLGNIAMTTSGGAIRVDAATSIGVISSNFTSNIASKKGGAIYVEYTENYFKYPEKRIFELSRSHYTENSASEGGALALDGDISITGSVNWMTSNQAAYGGAINVELNSNSLPNFSNFVFKRNIASVTGAVLVIHAEKPFVDSTPYSWRQQFQRDNVFLDQPGSPSLQFAPIALFPITVTASLHSDPLGYTDQAPQPQNPRAPVATLYPGIPRSILLKVEDQVGTSTFDYSEWSVSLEGGTGALDLLRRLQLDSSFRSVTTSDGLSGDSSVILSISVTLSPEVGSSNSSLESTLQCVVILNVPSLASTALLVQVSPCGIGTGPSKHSSDCIICPLGSYSFNGSCVSCIDNPYVSCFGGFIIPDRNYWVIINPSNGNYQVLRCPSGFCVPKNPKLSACHSDRTGVMCGECVNGLSESILPTCIKCTKPNWVMICISVVGLWITVLLIHSLVAVSSGKATILIFFIQASFIINRQISLFGSDSRLPAFVSFIICIIPLNPLARSLLIGLIPFVLMAMISITFGVRYLAKLIEGLLWPRSSNESQSALVEYPSELIASENTISVPPYEQVDQDDSEVQFELEINLEASESEQFESANSSKEDPLGVFMVADSPLQDSTSEKVDAIDSTRVNEFYQYQMETVYWHPYRLVRTILSLLAGSFSSVLGIAISTIHCVTLLDGRRVLQSSPSISCSSNRFKVFQYLNFIWAPYLILLLFGILGKLVHGYRKKKLSATDVRFGMWYEMYKPRFFAWKATEMIRRFVLSITAELLLSEPMSRSIALFAISMCFLAIHLITKPYRQRLENRLETLSLTCLALISLVNIWNVKLFALSNPPKASIYFVWIAAILVSAIIGLTIVFTKVRSTIFARTG